MALEGGISIGSLLLAKLHGAYNLMGGLWPLLSMALFEAATGPKQDEWLLRTVAGILTFTGGLLLHDVFFRKRIDRYLRVMAFGIAAVLALVALVSSVGGWIARIYFLYGLARLTFAIAWVFILRRSGSSQNAARTLN